jgi:DNA-binding LacI/PurR family transcriptional regulator
MDIQEVARQAKVSTATVSRVLNGSANVREETTARVRRVIAELNYVPNRNARNLRVGRTKLFGLIVSDIKNPFFPELIDAFESLAVAQGIEVIFTHTNYDPQRLRSSVRRMIDRNVDAIAVMTSEVDRESLEQAVTARVPFVLMNQREFEGVYPNIAVEYTAGFSEGIEHLQALGHRSIGFIAGPEALNSAMRRKEAFLAALEERGLPVRPEWIVAGDMRVEGGRAATEELLGRGARPTALMTTNDLMAVGALQAARGLGVRVPEDLSIVGFDDLPVAGMLDPPLSTIQVPKREMAARAFATLQQRLLGGESPAFEPLQPGLVVRESTGLAARQM